MEDILNKYPLISSIKSELYKSSLFEIIELKNLTKLEENKKNKSKKLIHNMNVSFKKSKNSNIRLEKIDEINTKDFSNLNESNLDNRLSRSFFLSPQNKNSLNLSYESSNIDKYTILFNKYFTLLRLINSNLDDSLNKVIGKIENEKNLNDNHESTMASILENKLDYIIKEHNRYKAMYELFIDPDYKLRMVETKNNLIKQNQANSLAIKQLQMKLAEFENKEKKLIKKDKNILSGISITNGQNQSNLISSEFIKSTMDNINSKKKQNNYLTEKIIETQNKGIRVIEKIKNIDKKIKMINSQVNQDKDHIDDKENDLNNNEQIYKPDFNDDNSRNILSENDNILNNSDLSKTNNLKNNENLVNQIMSDKMIEDARQIIIKEEITCELKNSIDELRKKIKIENKIADIINLMNEKSRKNNKFTSVKNK